MVAQFYETRVIDEFVLRGNSVIMKCNLPSFVADFVYVEAWISIDDSDITEYYANNTKWGIVTNETFIFCSRIYASKSLSLPLLTHSPSILSAGKQKKTFIGCDDTTVTLINRNYKY